ncbi:hypothetical protein AALA21_03200 [Eggerthellaceae bacterium 3-80]|nr:hypothetical protein D7W09_04000 [bacterium D16-34]
MKAASSVSVLRKSRVVIIGVVLLALVVAAVWFVPLNFANTFRTNTATTMEAVDVVRDQIVQQRQVARDASAGGAEGAADPGTLDAPGTTPYAVYDSAGDQLADDFALGFAIPLYVYENDALWQSDLSLYPLYNYGEVVGLFAFAPGQSFQYNFTTDINEGTTGALHLDPPPALMPVTDDVMLELLQQHGGCAFVAVSGREVNSQDESCPTQKAPVYGDGWMVSADGAAHFGEVLLAYGFGGLPTEGDTSSDLGEKLVGMVDELQFSDDVSRIPFNV